MPSVRPALLALAASLACIGMTEAQVTDIDTCATRAECEGLVEARIAKAKETLARGLFQDAARHLYPVVQTDNEALGLPGRLSGYDALADILLEAGLPGYAASQLAAANGLTDAPSSARLLREASLLRIAGNLEDARDAYARSEALAMRAANLETLDALAADHEEAGDLARTEALRASRRDVARRFDRACSAVRCRSAEIVEPRLADISAPDYPTEAQRAGLSGSCSVTLNITEAGEPADLTADCSDPVFVSAALEWAGQTEFSQRFVNGVPVPAYGVVLPLDFALR